MNPQAKKNSFLPSFEKTTEFIEIFCFPSPSIFFSKLQLFFSIFNIKISPLSKVIPILLVSKEAPIDKIDSAFGVANNLLFFQLDLAPYIRCNYP